MTWIHQKQERIRTSRIRTNTHKGYMEGKGEKREEERREEKERKGEMRRKERKRQERGGEERRRGGRRDYWGCSAELAHGRHWSIGVEQRELETL